MRQCIDDDFLYKAMPAAEADMLSAIPPEDELKHTFSRRFERKMQALLRYERRTPFARRAAAVGRGVAAAVLAAVILNAALIGGVKAYRDGFYEIIETVTRKYTTFNVKVSESIPPTEFKPIEPPYVPEGYREEEKQENEMGQQIIYSSNDGTVFIYEQRILMDGTVMVDTEDAVVQNKEICGYEVLFITEGEMTQIYWVCGGHSFSLVGNAAFEELQMVAEKILKIFEK